MCPRFTCQRLLNWKPQDMLYNFQTILDSPYALFFFKSQQTIVFLCCWDFTGESFFWKPNSSIQPKLFNARPWITKEWGKKRDQLRAPQGPFLRANISQWQDTLCFNTVTAAWRGDSADRWGGVLKFADCVVPFGRAGIFKGLSVPAGLPGPCFPTCPLPPPLPPSFLTLPLSLPSIPQA